MVLILEAVSPGLRGELTRWLQRIGETTFIGSISAEVREAIWELAVRRCAGGRITLAWSTSGEPGYSIRLHNHPTTTVIDLDGLPLLARQDAAWTQAMARFHLAMNSGAAHTATGDT